MIGSRLAGLESLIHNLRSIEKTSKPSSDSDSSLVYALSLLLSKLTQTVWPALAVLGGVDAGLCLGRLCCVEGVEGEVLVASVPSPGPKLEVMVQEVSSTHAAQIVSKYVTLRVPQCLQYLQPLLDTGLGHHYRAYSP